MRDYFVQFRGPCRDDLVDGGGRLLPLSLAGDKVAALAPEMYFVKNRFRSKRPCGVYRHVEIMYCTHGFALPCVTIKIRVNQVMVRAQSASL